MDISRRQFLKKTSGSLAFGVAVSQGLVRPISARAAAQAAAESSDKIQRSETRHADMVYRKLGRTAEKVSLIGLGGYHIGKQQLTDEDSIKIIRTAIDRGITGIDSMQVLDQALEAVGTYKPMSNEEIEALLARTRTAALYGRFESYKMSSYFGGTAHNRGSVDRPRQSVQLPASIRPY